MRHAIGAGGMGLLGLLALGLAGGGARASAADHPPPVVFMHVAADGSVVVALGDRLRPRLGALGVELVVSVAAAVDVDAVLGTVANVSDAAPVAEVWLDGRASADATLFLVPRLADRVVARRLALAAGFDEVALAEIVYIVERSVAALLAAQPVGVSRDEARALLRAPPVSPVDAPAPVPAVAPAPAAPVPAVAPVPAPAASGSPASVSPAPAAASPASAGEISAHAEPSLQLGAFVGAEGWSSAASLVPTLGVAAIVERKRARLRVGLGVDGQWRPGFQLDTPDGKASVTGGAAHLLLALARSFGDLGTGRLLVGPGVLDDRVQLASSLTTGKVTAPARNDVALGLRAMARWDLPLGRRVAVFATAGLDVLSVAGRYTAVVDGASTVLLQAWPVRPTASLGVTVGDL
jgi:hypothetical protein